MEPNTPLNRIKSLLPSLPPKDIKIGEKFISKRDFESLKLLVDSAIIRVKKGLLKDVIKEDYLKADLIGMSKLKAEVDSYYQTLELSYNDYEDDDEDFDEDLEYEMY